MANTPDVLSPDYWDQPEQSKPQKQGGGDPLSSEYWDAPKPTETPLQAAGQKSADERFSWLDNNIPVLSHVPSALRWIAASDPGSRVPGASKLMDRAAAATAATWRGPQGSSFGDRYKGLTEFNDAARQRADDTHPGAELTGTLGSAAVTPMFGAAKIGPAAAGLATKIGAPAIVSKAAGLAGNTAGIAGLGAVYGGLSGAEQGDTLAGKASNALAGVKDSLTQTVPVAGYNVPVPIAMSVAAPLAGKALGWTASKIPGINKISLGKDRAASAVADAMDQDAATRARLSTSSGSREALGMTDADIAASQAAQQPWMLADRGGENVRSLARASVDVSPDASATLKNPAQGRFATQATRFNDYLTNMFGNQGMDAEAIREGLKAQSRAQNKVAYDAAYNHPNAQNMWDQDYSRMMQSPAMQEAVTKADKLNQTISAAQGAKAQPNPFIKDSHGDWVLRNSGAPNLQFWDYIKQALDDKTTAAFRNGLGKEGTAYGQLRDALRSKLDTSVPEYGQARQGAASFFGAQDAHEAGTNFLRNMDAFDTSRAKNALNQMKPADRHLFSLGMASDIANKVARTGDSTNVVRMFNNPAMREKLQLGLGQQRAFDLETYLRRESMMDMLRSSLSGGSNTAKNLFGMGALGTIGTAADAYMNWNDIKNGDVGALAHSAGIGAVGALTTALSHYGHRVDQRTIPEIARLLASTNPADMQRLRDVAIRDRNVADMIRRTQTSMAARFLDKGAPQREQHAKGGRVGPSHTALVSRLFSLSEKAKREQKAETKPLLDIPDEPIVKALALAQGH